MAESILSLSLTAVHTVFHSPPAASADSAIEEEKVEDEADVRLVVGGVVLSCVSCVFLVAIVFGEEGIKWWATIIALVLASIFSILGSVPALSSLRTQTDPHALCPASAPLARPT